MSRIETLRDSAHEQAKPATARARSTAQAQAEMVEQLERLAVDMSSIMSRWDETMAESEASIERGAMRISQAVETGMVAIRTSMDETSTMPIEARRFRWTALAIATTSGIIAGMAALIGLLIWQPPLIQGLWRMAAALHG